MPVSVRHTHTHTHTHTHVHTHTCEQSGRSGPVFESYTCKLRMSRWELALSALSPMRASDGKSRAIARQLHALDKLAFIVLRCKYGYTCICVNSRGCSQKATLTSSKGQVSQANVWEEKTSVSFFPAFLVQPMAK